MTNDTFFYVLIVIVAAFIVLMIIKSSRLKKYDGIVHKSVIDINEENINEQVSEGIVLIEFWAVWCKPCKYQAPILNELAEDSKVNVKICKVNIDNNKSLVDKYKIHNIPSILIFKEGELIHKFVGFKSKHFLSKTLKRLNKQ